MHYRRLGKTGIKVSEISLGAWVTFGGQLDDAAAIGLVQEAFDQGVNFFDNADVYAGGRAEIVMGKAIADLPREALVLSSKVFWPTMPGPNGRGLSRKHIFESLHASLRRLGTDYLDIYFCHRFDPDTAIEEVVRSMSDLVRQGKILYWGTSEWQPWQIAIAWGIAQRDGLVPPVVEQPQYHMFHRQRVEEELAPLCREIGLGLTTWSPLAFGILTGKYNDGIPADSRAAREDTAWLRDHLTSARLDAVRALGVLAADLGLSTAQLAIAWLLRRKEVSTVITGATRVEHLHENIRAGDVVSLLTDDVLDSIETILEGVPPM
ncbi:MAG: aldo/keto reductase [Anaerolineae bacterium]|nr:MAG: aldo/keto reductase [Anaerolineae bacterium]